MRKMTILALAGLAGLPVLAPAAARADRKSVV